MLAGAVSRTAASLFDGQAGPSTRQALGPWVRYARIIMSSPRARDLTVIRIAIGCAFLPACASSSTGTTTPTNDAAAPAATCCVLTNYPTEGSTSYLPNSQCQCESGGAAVDYWACPGVGGIPCGCPGQTSSGCDNGCVFAFGPYSGESTANLAVGTIGSCN